MGGDGRGKLSHVFLTAYVTKLFNNIWDILTYFAVSIKMCICFICTLYEAGDGTSISDIGNAGDDARNFSLATPTFFET